MRMPGQIRVGGRIFTIKHPYKFDDHNTPLNGLCEIETQIIKISNTTINGDPRHEQGVKQTIMHEILHAIDYVYNNYQLSKMENGDMVIDQLAEGITQVLQDNNLDFSDE